MIAKKGYKAIAKNLPMSPTKIRPIADNLRGKRCTDAIAALENMPNKGAGFLKKVIESATANALYQNKNLDEEMLIVKELLVDEGRRFKRMWPRSRGRADVLLKRYSHISVVVDESGKAGE